LRDPHLQGSVGLTRGCGHKEKKYSRFALAQQFPVRNFCCAIWFYAEKSILGLPCSSGVLVAIVRWLFLEATHSKSLDQCFCGRVGFFWDEICSSSEVLLDREFLIYGALGFFSPSCYCLLVDCESRQHNRCLRFGRLPI
jgi:hypothetical protein